MDGVALLTVLVPTAAVRTQVKNAPHHDVPMFRQMMREITTVFATAGERGIPAILLANPPPANPPPANPPPDVPAEPGRPARESATKTGARCPT